MSKTYKGYELMKAIADGEIKNRSRFLLHPTVRAILENKTLHFENGNKREIITSDLLLYTFELIEENTIDIEEIKELDKNNTFINNKVNDQKIIDLQNKTNELVKAVKQLNQRLKKLEG